MGSKWDRDSGGQGLRHNFSVAVLGLGMGMHLLTVTNCCWDSFEGLGARVTRMQHATGVGMQCIKYSTTRTLRHVMVATAGGGHL